jgi:hypothetical protein
MKYKDFILGIIPYIAIYGLCYVVFRVVIYLIGEIF